MAVGTRHTAQRARSAFTTVGGVRIHHLAWGPPDGPPLVLLHGLRAHAHVWERTARYLAPPYRLLAPDLRGHGESAWTDEGYGNARYAADLGGWLDAQGLARVDLIGHSAGGRVAVSYAAHHPERVRRLVVVDMGPDVPIPAFDPKLAAAPPRRFADIGAVVALLRQRYPAISEAYLRRLARHSVRPSPEGALMWKWDTRVRGQAPPPEVFRADLRALRCPTLIVRGEQGYLRADWAANMQALIPESRVVTVPRAGHCVAEERPGQFAAIVRAWLDES